VLDLGVLLDATISLHGLLIQEDGQRTRALATLLDNGTPQPVISRLLPLEAGAEAHRILKSRHTGTNIVLDFAGS